MPRAAPQHVLSRRTSLPPRSSRLTSGLRCRPHHKPTPRQRSGALIHRRPPSSQLVCALNMRRNARPPSCSSRSTHLPIRPPGGRSRDPSSADSKVRSARRGRRRRSSACPPPRRPQKLTRTPRSRAGDELCGVLPTRLGCRRTAHLVLLTCWLPCALWRAIPRFRARPRRGPKPKIQCAHAGRQRRHAHLRLAHPPQPRVLPPPPLRAHRGLPRPRRVASLSPQTRLPRSAAPRHTAGSMRPIRKRSLQL